MNRLALGTVQFGMPYGVANQQGQVSLEAVRDILIRARSAGMDVLDTAIAYGDSEQRLGSIGVESWKVISKLPRMPETTRNVVQWTQQTVRDSLDRLKIVKLYGLLLHYPQQLLYPEGKELYNSLKILKQEGWISKIGISIYTPNELEILSSHFDFDLVQAPFNLLDRNLLRSGWLHRLQTSGVEIHVRSIFLQGLLLMSFEKRPQKFNRWQSLWHQWDRWLKDANISPLEACLNYVFSFPEISKIVIGVDTLSQLEAILNIKQMSLNFPDFLAVNDPDLIDPSRWQNL